MIYVLRVFEAILFQIPCKFSSVSSLLCLATRRVYERSTIKVLLSTVRINERFGTAIAIWVFSIGSYSSTTGFIVICHSQNEKRCKNLPMNRVFGETTQNRRKIVFLQIEICVKNLALANVNQSISDTAPLFPKTIFDCFSYNARTWWLFCYLLQQAVSCIASSVTNLFLFFIL